MNPISSDLLETKVQPGLSPDQRTWLKKLGTLVGGPAASSVAPAKAAAPARPAPAAQNLKTGAAPGGKTALVEGFSPLDIPADILKTPEELLGPLSCTCLINNNTDKGA